MPPPPLLTLDAASFPESGLCYKEYNIMYILERNDEKLIIFVFIAIFVSYCPQFWGSGG
jgi:hypothetical protein